MVPVAGYPREYGPCGTGLLLNKGVVLGYTIQGYARTI